MGVLHQIPLSRTTIQYFEKRAESQGVSEVILKRRCLRKSREELVDFLEEQLFGQEWSFEQMRKTQEQMHTKEATLDYREKFIRCRLAYLNGIQKAISG